MKAEIIKIDDNIRHYRRFSESDFQKLVILMKELRDKIDDENISITIENRETMYQFLDDNGF